MREFFKPRQRKMGVATLVMACFVGIAWSRSGIVEDTVFVPHRAEKVVSASGYIFVKIPHEQVAESWAWPMWQSVPLLIYRDDEFRGTAIFFDRFQVKHSVIRDVVIWHVFTIPYHTLCIPLTLLSAYLLLSKPRSMRKVPVPHA